MIYFTILDSLNTVLDIDIVVSPDPLDHPVYKSIESIIIKTEKLQKPYSISAVVDKDISYFLDFD